MYFTINIEGVTQLEFVFAYMVIIFLVIIIIPKYLKFIDSSYEAASGNNFWQTAFNKGNYGEFLTYFSLEKMEGNHKLLTNLYVPKEDGSTTEIDLLLISESGIFVFESKNYSGWIFGNEKYQKWTQTFPNKKKYQFFNPIWQNNGHISALKNVMKLENDALFKSYIIFSERCTLKKITLQSENVKVIKRNSLIPNVKRDIAESPKILSPEQVQVIYKVLRRYALADEVTKQAHIAAVKAKV